MTRPRLLDLFCGAGGAAKGYEAAGFDVVGVDFVEQDGYPAEFHRADALTFLAKHGREFDAIHASPPCQGYTLLQAVNKNLHPRLIEPTRALLEGVGVPWVIENVVGAPLVRDIVLCGEMFGLGVIRHRLFETSFSAVQPAHRKHRGRVRGWRHGTYFDGPYVAVYGDGGGKGSTAEWSDAMGIDWMSRDELREAIPPAYTEFVGAQLIQHVMAVAA
jgi:hypothetical protein